MAGFGDGLGAVIGANMANNTLENTQSDVNTYSNDARAQVGAIANDFKTTTSPYDSFGKSFLDPAAQAVGGVQAAAGDTMGYNQFMSGYENTPAAQYQMQQADAVQNNSAAARGGVLSGANNRALATINNGIVAQNANTAYDQYLKGDSQQFGQLESALGNMFKAIGIGQTATGQQSGVDTAQIGATSQINGQQVGATSSLGQAQAKNDNTKGSGLGSMFGGMTGFAF